MLAPLHPRGTNFWKGEGHAEQVQRDSQNFSLKGLQEDTNDSNDFGYSADKMTPITGSGRCENGGGNEEDEDAMESISSFFFGNQFKFSGGFVRDGILKSDNP